MSPSAGRVRPLRIAFAGAGAITLRHLALLRGLPGVEVVAICDPVEERARAACGALGARAFSAWQPMLDDQRPDVLFVCTPTFAHREPVVEALGRGTHVYVEKPLARTFEDARAIVDAWEASSAVCAVGFQWRSVDFLDEIRALLAQAPLAMLISRSLGPAEPGRLDRIATGVGRPWFMDPALGGGQLFELGSHDIDLQLALGGPVVRVHASAGARRVAQAGLPPSELPDTIALTLQFASGALGTVGLVWAGSRTTPVYALDVIAPDLALHVSLDPRFTLQGEALGRTVDAGVTAHPRLRTLERFLAAVRAGDRDAVPCTPLDGLRAVEVAVACERSIATGGPVELARSHVPHPGGPIR